MNAIGPSVKSSRLFKSCWFTQFSISLNREIGKILLSSSMSVSNSKRSGSSISRLATFFNFLS